MDYTVIGDSVNLAARLESANKHYGTSILLAGETIAEAKAPGLVRELDLIRVKGKLQPTAIYEALDHHTPDSFPDLERVLERFRNGVERYRARRWHDAHACFSEVLSLRPGDGPSRVYIDRCTYYAETPPPDEWDGVWTLTEK